MRIQESDGRLPVTGREARAALTQLLGKAGIEDAAFDAEQLVRHVSGRQSFAVGTVTREEGETMQQLARRRAQHEPLQYLLGAWPFLGVSLQVGPGVLIPRPETEEVCLAAANLLSRIVKKAERENGGSPYVPAVLDLCSGSGALALGLQSLFPAAEVTAVEWSGEAFFYLRKNIQAFAGGHKNAPKAVRADVFVYGETLPECSIDLIVANPPYVTEEEYAEVSAEVKKEPEQALVAGENGLAFYKTIAAGYRHALKAGGLVVFEIGAAQGGAVRDILAANGFLDIEVLQDMAGHNRIVTGRVKK